ncbi:MAG: hypothetical protein IJJ76_07995 [Ruminococcus sp.]|uniref:hypothetical protein n=1 Tax=Ruminococcus sp. TaxID=41978 RepID=UPI0025FFBFD2|nr:hypothetical protein [Ruminococcus sp.]MBR0529686.1 hypothetical protein [Ruminococcus sp.]
MNLNDYLLLKVFKSAERRDQFNKGDVYLSSTSNFWKLENSFQQDKEGGIFEQEGKGFLLKTNPDFPKILAKSTSLDDVLRYLSEENAGEVIAETADCSLRFEGYLCCFYLLSKKAISFTSNTLSITSDQERKDITLFLNKYLEDAPNHDFYVSIYDAVTFCKVFCKIMSDRGYSVSYGQVNYEDIDEPTRISRYQNGDGYTILFTKPTKYSYQKEFRIVVTKSNEPIKDHITESGIDIESCRFGSFDYANLCSKSTPEETTNEE